MTSFKSLLLSLFISFLTLPAAAQTPNALKILENICGEGHYDDPLDVATIAIAAGWKEIGPSQLYTTVNLYGSLWTLQHPMLDTKSATAEDIAATFRKMRLHVLSKLTKHSEGEHFGILYLETPQFTAFVNYWKSTSSPRVRTLPCEFLIIGEAHFLDDRFESNDWLTYSSDTNETASKQADGYLGAVSRNFIYGKNIENAGLSLPDYSLKIVNFKF